MKIEPILEYLYREKSPVADFFDYFFHGYKKSYTPARFKKLSQEEIKRIEKQKFYSILYYLQSQGLVKKQKDKNNKSCWIITQKGIKKVLLLRKKGEKMPVGGYKAEKSEKLKIIIFDIPEEEKRKRVWLRMQLRDLEFSMLQKSVWIGKNKLPTEFMEDLQSLQLLPYIEIFSADKEGSIGKVF